MTYQVLARKWRPQDFSSLIGQEPIVTALRNATLESRIAQAYLFSGIRGVGKTTAARVFAKSLNCERGPAPDPCNECAACREITAGTDIDVVEVDAATYSKVEQIRELTESLRYGPARDRYKVVVLDEVHRLSRQAFDALLKIVEEPPAHLVFVFATTEIDAVPATILSRCQEFRFRRVPSDRLAAYLREICNREEIRASDAALRLVARAGEGSVRDSVALLDQLATFGSGEISDHDAQNLLGGLDTAVFERTLRAILAGDRLQIAGVAHEVEQNGWDPHHVFVQFLAYVRDALHLAMGSRSESIDLVEEEAAKLGEIAASAGFENLLRLSQLLLQSEASIRRSELGALALELTWLRAAELPKLTAFEEVLAGAPPSQRAARPPQPSFDRPQAAIQGPIATQTGGGVSAFVEAIRNRKPPLAPLVARGEPRLQGRVLEIPVAEGDTFSRQTLERNRAFLDALVEEVFGAGMTWKVGRAGASAAPKTEAPQSSGQQQIQDDPTVKTVLEVFNGTIEKVE
ncbi:MAG: DNA polymerase III subunit gamma/tau [Thermoanaerobaculia bacterium]|nr:DNA polymerase III subunit gamma/tau [Thermoanaerobaculia bacterium]